MKAISDVFYVIFRICSLFFIFVLGFLTLIFLGGNLCILIYAMISGMAQILGAYI